MTSSRTLLVLLMASCMLLAGILPVAAAAASDPAATAPAAVAVLTASEGANHSQTLGEEVTSFMQASASEADGTVEAGMWKAQVNSVDNESERAQLVEHRVQFLDARAQNLQQEKRELIDARQNGSISQLEYQARMSRLVGDLIGLQAAIDQTKAVGERSGADLSRLGHVQNETANVTGPELMAITESPAVGQPPTNATAAGENRLGNDAPSENAGPADGADSHDAGSHDGVAQADDTRSDAEQREKDDEKDDRADGRSDGTDGQSEPPDARGNPGGGPYIR